MFLVLLLALALCDPQPVRFKEYYANTTQTASGQGVHTTLYYVDVNATKAVGKQSWPGGEYEYDMYHLAAFNSLSYEVRLKDGKFDGCRREYLGFHEMDILDFLEDSEHEYLGEQSCNDKKCDVWSVGPNWKYWAIVSVGTPVWVQDREGDKVIIFNDFKSGKKAFDEGSIFKMPVDPEVCD